MSYVAFQGLGFALQEKMVDTATGREAPLPKLLTIDQSASTMMAAPSIDEEGCMEFQRALAAADLYDGPIDGDLFRVAEIRNQLRAEHGFALVAANTSITEADFAALDREIRAMEYGEGPPPAIIPDVPLSQAQGGGAGKLLIPAAILAALVLL